MQKVVNSKLCPWRCPLNSRHRLSISHASKLCPHTILMEQHSSYSIFLYSLPNHGRILPALTFNGRHPLNINPGMILPWFGRKMSNCRKTRLTSAVIFYIIRLHATSRTDNMHSATSDTERVFQRWPKRKTIAHKAPSVVSLSETKWLSQMDWYLKQLEF